MVLFRGLAPRPLFRVTTVGLLLTVGPPSPATAFAAYSLNTASAPATPAALPEPSLATATAGAAAGLGDPAVWRLAMRAHAFSNEAESARAAAARALEVEATLGSRRPRRIILTSSSSGISAVETRAVFERMLAASRAERAADWRESGLAGAPDERPPRIAFVLTAALAGSSERPTGVAEAAEAIADAMTLPAVAATPAADAAAEAEWATAEADEEGVARMDSAGDGLEPASYLQPRAANADGGVGGGGAGGGAADGGPPAAPALEQRRAPRSAGEARRRRLANARRKAKLLSAALGASIGGTVDLQAIVLEEERAHDRRERVRPPLLRQSARTADAGASGGGGGGGGIDARDGDGGGAADADGGARLERARSVRDACFARLLETLGGADAIWVMGGNTFHLRHWMAQSGFDAVLLRLVGQRGVPYVGQSAGAIVAGVSAHTALWKGWDDPGAAPPPTGLEPAEPDIATLAAISAATPPSLVVGTRPPAAADWTFARLAGVGLVPCSVFPHHAPQWAALCDRLERTELRAAAATAAALHIAADVADAPERDALPPFEPADAAAAAGEPLSRLIRLRDGESFIWDESQPDVHRSILGAPERADEPWPQPAGAGTGMDAGSAGGLGVRGQARGADERGRAERLAQLEGDVVAADEARGARPATPDGGEHGGGPRRDWPPHAPPASRVGPGGGG
ncbi:hypothetical protein KFE25_011165 [Diacronema lutheri]|uniref:Uncharacterized protein n=2 Tax=Diacronema lutheri TaxID=2081491 RepID=A0A8J5XFM4_DIALT|nr:hypothetical protein KFE25_011165 [Diacronema lutheri]